MSGSYLVAGQQEQSPALDGVHVFRRVGRLDVDRSGGEDDCDGVRMCFDIRAFSLDHGLRVSVAEAERHLQLELFDHVDDPVEAES